ncbi:MAG TPA: adenylate/guanylate cyclase domain-containing protein, partial [Clostridia bacterium]|nr:adenylate/guanylate cyclase domain-containing protein [Clostridia bacterium]
LFADLVGFTSLAEGRDPELVRELLTRYFDLARQVVEQHGGIVEKFIGDAVMALWGAPVAKEDDAERAVRAALELVDAVHALGPGLEARAAVLTGEAAVTIGAIGQGMVAGDLVNTASRLQSAAAPGTVLVGEATHRAASTAITFEPADEQHLKGKAAPVAAWRAVRVVAQRRGRGREDRLEAPFVGRDAELRLLKDLFHATTRDRRVRLVSITGQAGIGKSRLAWEFLKYVDGVVDTVFWHEGRSPAYGQGLSFWALGEMVRSRADLLETDDEPTTRSKIRETVEQYVTDEDERRRVEAALLALLGVGDAPEGGSQGMFAAWRTFFERIAATGSVALLFEDLHWADSGMLDFIDHMLDWSLNVPILIVTLARPELLDSRPGWGAGRRNFLALDLQPIDDASMRELLEGLVSGLPESAIRSIVSRAEGIPLYAVETIRMLIADGRLVPLDDGRFQPAGDLGELAIPETLHALIAARLDTLAPEDRLLVQDAAVLGQSFTTAALSAVSGLDADGLEPRLAALVRADLFRREVDPRSPERGQYAFVQAVIREVAYSTLAMRDRRARHLAAARFFESLGDEELAGALATHYLAAFHSAAEGPEAQALASQARIALRAAADRAIALGAPLQAVAYLEQALEVADTDEERASMLEQAGDAASIGARTEEALPLLERAQTIRESLGEDRAVARVIGLRARALTEARQYHQAVTLLRPALERFASLAESEEGLTLAAGLARNLIRLGQYADGLAAADDVLLRAERMNVAGIASEMLIGKGQAYGFQGRMWEARALYEGARSLAEEIGRVDLVSAATQNLSFEIALDDSRRAVELQREGLEIQRRLGRKTNEITILGNLAEDARRTGDWDWVLAELDAVMSRHPDGTDTIPLRIAHQLVLTGRGEEDAAEIAAIAAGVAELADPDVRIGVIDIRASAAYAAGRWTEAAIGWLEAADMSDLNEPYLLPRAAHALVLAGDAAGARSVLDRMAMLGTRGRAVDADRMAIRAGIEALEGDAEAALAGYRQAIAAWRALRLPWDEALTILDAVTRIGIADPEVAGWVDAARASLEGLRATPLLARLDEAVAAAGAAAPRAAPSARSSTPVEAQP